MFQNFGVQSSPEQGPARLTALRREMAREGIDCFLVPRADAHQGEYVAPCDARLAWLTGFTGSAGFCAALKDVAGVFIDGRYRLQVKTQVASDFTPVHWPETELADWLKQHLPQGGVVGFDPWLHSIDEIDKLTRAVGPAISLRATDNLVDRIWDDRPAPPSAKFFAHPVEFAGESHADKCTRLTAAIDAGAYVITLSDSLAWLLNIRGRDIERNPVPQGFALLHHDGTVDLFAGAGKADDVRDHLGGTVRVHENGFLDALAGLTGPVFVHARTCPKVVETTLKNAGVAVEIAEDPCLLPKARKNKTEIAGARAAHLRDGAAMARFLAWLDAAAPTAQLTEIDVVTELEKFRRDTNVLQDISFETICGAGPNGAIMHYRVSDDSNRPVKTDELLLVDSGGQYLDGTTDITRTVIVGTPQPDHIACYTRVLQGLIAVSRVRFPKGVGGQHLDALARYPLWTAGMDFDHGTGHGVGSYLSVHEGPQGLSRRSQVPLEAGMILSNEPGYYRPGAFGIRLENLIVTVPAPALSGADDRDMLAFETLTFVPFDRRLIDTTMLANSERDWIDAYHATTITQIGPLVDGATRAWMTMICAPL
jgi:Xaa-Pro aminopeptidase